jgi:hypothetical protein
MQSIRPINDTSVIVSESRMGVRIIDLMQGFYSLLIIAGLIDMIKSKKRKAKEFLLELL